MAVAQIKQLIIESASYWGELSAIRDLVLGLGDPLPVVYWDAAF